VADERNLGVAEQNPNVAEPVPCFGWQKPEMPHDLAGHNTLMPLAGVLADLPGFH